MSAPSSSLPAAFSLAAVFSWGTSDFLGGYAARRAETFLLTSIAHISGLVLMTTLALASGAAIPSSSNIGWALAAGLSGGAALAIFYRALSAGKMGLTAPVAAVFAAVLATSFGIFKDGFPGSIQLAGFVLAGFGIWLISRTEGAAAPEGFWQAILAGAGFAGFYICIKQAGDGSALWMAAFSRVSALSITVAILLAAGRPRRIERQSVAWGILAGCLDVGGSVMFIRASQSGRLDSAVVISSLYPAITVLLARLILKEHFTRWKTVGMVAALAAVPMIAMQ